MNDESATPTVAVVIVAAGRGHRVGHDLPKQFIPLGSACAYRRSLDAFLAVDVVRWIVPVIHPDDAELSERASQGLSGERLAPPVIGGDTRAHSVRCGLEALERFRPDLVLIHDSARPFVPRRVINEVIAALKTSDGACAALPVVDALWRSDNGLATSPVPRDGLWRAQTPQGFHFSKILNAHREHDGRGADDVAVAREYGLTVSLVPGSDDNYKITTPLDVERALRHVRVDAAGAIKSC